MNIKVLTGEHEEVEIREYEDDVSDTVRELNLNMEGLEQEEAKPDAQKAKTVAADSAAQEPDLSTELEDDKEDKDEAEAELGPAQLAKVLSERFAGLAEQRSSSQETGEADTESEPEAAEELTLEDKLAQLSRIIGTRLESDTDTKEKDASGKRSKRSDKVKSSKDGV